MSQTASQAQVEREQNLVKDTAQGAVQGVRKIRDEGLHNPGMPTTEGAVDKLQKTEDMVDAVQHSYRGQQTGGKGQEVLQDIKRVIEDQKTIVRKNDGDLLQHILQNTCTFLTDMSSDSSMKGVFSNWQHLLNSLLNTNNMSEVVASGTEIFRSLKDTEEFLHLASEMLNMMKILVAEGEARVNPGNADKLNQIWLAKDQSKEEIMEDLVELLRTLATNEIWKSMLARAKHTSHKVKGAAVGAKDAASETVNRVLDSNTTTQIINDVRVFLQRLVGDQMNVDSFFNALAQVLLDFSENQQLADVVVEVQEQLQTVANVPEMLDDIEVKQRLADLSKRAQGVVDSMMNTPSFNALRNETQRLTDSIMNEPSTARLIYDTRKLFHDIKSDQPGQLFDPTLLTGVRQMIIPMFLDHLNNIPVPPIQDQGEFMGPYDYSLSNIKLSIPDMLPENIHLRFDHEMDANIMNLSATNQRTFVFLEARDIHVHLRDVAWSYHRHKLPRFADSGLADIDTEGKGVIIRMKMELRNDLSNKDLVEVHASRVIIDRFHITFHESKHNKMYKMLTHLFQNKIKKEVEIAMENKMKDFGMMLNGQIATLMGQAQVKSHEYRGMAGEKFVQAKETMVGLKQQAIETKDMAKVHAGSLKDQTLAAVQGGSGQAKEILREQARKVTGETDPEVVLGEAKEEIKDRGRGAITIAAERATGFLDEQQQKIEEQRLEKQFQKQAQIGDPDPKSRIGQEFPMVDLSKKEPTMPTVNLSKEPTMPTVNLSKEPFSQKPETPEEKQYREMQELREMKAKQQAGSSDVPLGFGATSSQSSADLLYQLHSDIPSFTAPTPKTEDKASVPAKQGL